MGKIQIRCVVRQIVGEAMQLPAGVIDALKLAPSPSGLADWCHQRATVRHPYCSTYKSAARRKQLPHFAIRYIDCVQDPINIASYSQRWHGDRLAVRRPSSTVVEIRISG